MRALALCLAFCASALLACEGPNLPKSWRITYARVLATRAEVIGDEERATPEPGEPLRVRILIVSGEPVGRVSYVLRVCPSALPNGQLARCTGAVIAGDAGASLSEPRFDHELTLELDVPDDGALEGAPTLLVQGAICTDGDAQLDAELNARCADGDAEPVAWVAHIALARRESERNANPVFASDSIELDGETWQQGSKPVLGDASTADEDAGEIDAHADAGAARSVAADGKQHQITLKLAGSAREMTEDGPEELLLSHFVTSGRLERRFSVLERSNADDVPLTVKWTSPPAERSPPRMVAAFVMRDQRGGVAYTVRELQLEP